MARTNLVLNTLTPNAGIVTPATTVVDPTNGMNVLLPATAIPASPDMDTMFFLVTNTAGSTKTFTVRAGANPPAFRAGVGDLVVTLAATTGAQYVGPFDPARFAQADGSINVDFQSAQTGNITAFIMPNRF